MYTCIIFAQDGSDILDEVQEIFCEDGYIAAIERLSQFDFGTDSEYDLVESIPRNLHEIHFKHKIGCDEYTLVEHPMYMALYRETFED